MVPDDHAAQTEVWGVKYLVALDSDVKKGEDEG